MTTGDYAVLTDIEQLSKLADTMLAKGLTVGFDIESGYSGPDFAKRATDHFHPDQFTVGFSLTSGTSWARYVPLRHDGGGNVSSVSDAWEAVTPLLTKGNIVAHNAKFEMHAVKKAHNIDLCAEGTLTDTMIDSYVLGIYAHKFIDQKTGKETPFRTMLGLKDLVKELFGHEMVHIQDLFPDKPDNWRPKLRFNILELTPTVVSYACEDAAWVLALKNAISEQAQKERPVMRGLEHKIFRILRDMEIQGVSVDWPGVEAAYAQALTFGPQMEQAVKKGLGELSGQDVSEMNLASPAQVKKLLYRDAGLSTTRLTKKGQEDASLENWERMSTDAKAMKTLSDQYPAIKKMLEYKEVNTLKNSKLKKWVTEYNNSIDGKVHANYKQAGVEESSGTAQGDAPGTGRFSAAEPAIQQLQKDWRWSTELGLDPFKDEQQDWWNEVVANGENGVDYWKGNYRDFIIASPNSYLLTYDYSQIELRMLAGVSQEPALLEAFKLGTDVHSVTAAQMLGKNIEDLNKETERPIGKTMNFALLYGMGAQSLSEQLGKSMDEAEALYAQYFSAFSRVSSWMEQMRTIGMKRGYAETIFGRRYTVWELYSQNKAIRAKGRRVLVNAPIQGAAADYMKIAMLRVSNKLKELDLWLNGCTIVMNQHDSLTFEVDNSIDPNWIKEIFQKEVVFGAETFKILKGFPTIVADWEIGQKWGSSSKWKDGQSAIFDDSAWTLDNEETSSKVLQQVLRDGQSSNSELSFENGESQLSIVSDKRTDTKNSKINEPIINITVSENPTRTRFTEFLTFIKANPGENKVHFISPDGEFDLPSKTSIGLEQQGKISLILGGASVRSNLPNIMDLTAGMSL